MVKKVLKIILTIICSVGIAFEIYGMSVNYNDGGLFLLVLAICSFIVHIFAWITPKTLFNLCWRVSKYYPDDFDYDTSLSKIGNVGLGILITAIILLGLSVLLTLLQ